MCAPLSQQQPLAQSLQLTAKCSGWPNKEWNSGLPAWPNEQRGYVYYNLVETEADVWEALLVVELNYPPEGGRQRKTPGTWPSRASRRSGKAGAGW